MFRNLLYPLPIHCSSLNKQRPWAHQRLIDCTSQMPTHFVHSCHFTGDTPAWATLSFTRALSQPLTVLPACTLFPAEPLEELPLRIGGTPSPTSSPVPPSGLNHRHPFLPQDLCTDYSLCLEHSSLSSFLPSLCHHLRGASLTPRAQAGPPCSISAVFPW